MRAMRIGGDFWVNTRNILRRTGRLLLLGTAEDLERLNFPPNMERLFSEPLLTSNRSHLVGVGRKD
jgi:hypothetical protein